MPRSHTVHGTSNANAARRSVDSLALPQSGIQGHWQSQIPSHLAQDARVSQSESGSPQLGPFGQHRTSDTHLHQGPLPPYSLPEPAASLPSNSVQDFGFLFPENDLPAQTAESVASMNSWSSPPSAIEATNQGFDWGNVDLNNVDWNNFDWVRAGQPALTNPSSASLSEIDELPSGDDTTGEARHASTEAQAGSDLVGTGPDNLDVANFDNVYPGDGSQSSRWSLPASFWGTPALGSNMPTGTDSHLTRVLKEDQSYPKTTIPTSQPPMSNQMSPLDYPLMTSGFAPRPVSSTMTARPARPRSIHAKRDGIADMSQWSMVFPQLDNSTTQPAADIGSASTSADFPFSVSGQSTTTTIASTLSEVSPEFQQAYSYPSPLI
ncbi:hypothetical protein H2203_000231 [Taxawa tesnikishii (nom. ined.)]|nr:hypothetical protein H2203_000231 [Dothideales sp. JES 119]